MLATVARERAAARRPFTSKHLHDSNDSRRIRTLAAVALFWAVAIALMIAMGMLRGMLPPAVAPLAWGVVSSALLLVLSALALRREGRATADAGLRFETGSIARFAVGLAIGAAMYGTHLLLLVGVAGVRLGDGAARGGAPLLLAALTFLALSVMEEVGFRGWPLRRLERALGRAPALLIGALAFALLHVAYGWPPVNALLGAGTGALVFGTAALTTRGLAVPIGMHAAWNLGDWSVGQKDTAGPWRLLTENVTAGAAQIGNVSYFLVMGLAVLGFALYARRARRGAPAN